MPRLHGMNHAQYISPNLTAEFV